MRAATASAMDCRWLVAVARRKPAREAKSAETVTVVTARRLCLNGQAGWRSAGPASEDEAAAGAITQA